MRGRLFRASLFLLIGIAVVVLLIGVISPATLDPRTIAAWRENQSNTTRMPFYAKVVDEMGQPVGGATITLRAILHDHRDLIGKAGRSERIYMLTADANGRAALKDVEGFRIYVDAVVKPGFRWYFDADGAEYRGERSTNNQRFNYSTALGRYTADRDNPAVFPLYREGVTQPDPVAGTSALPSRGGYTDGVRGEPFVPRVSSLDGLRRP